jgi:monofunctional biosynthetic peptidoglycan transglycosylase
MMRTEKKSPWRWVRRAVLLVIAGPMIYLLWLPYVPALRTHNPTGTTLMERRQKQAREAGKVLKPLYLWKDLRDISPHLVHAVLLSEDDMFYQHHGFDMEQIRIALQMDWQKKRYVYGGSTITQQLARSLYLSPSKSLWRKAKEALITVLLEKYLTKRRIMELYLNVVEWGPGIFGAEAAAQTYFQKPAKDLTPDEAVALASILPSPRRWSPLSERAFMARRRTRLYARLKHEGFLPVEISTDTTIPEDIQHMAEQANQLLLQQDTEENPLQPPAEDPDAHVVQTEDGLMVPDHNPPPQ